MINLHGCDLSQVSEGTEVISIQAGLEARFLVFQNTYKRKRN